MKKLFVLLGAVVLVVAFSAPAFAAEWSFYGSVRLTTFWTDESEERGPTGDDDLDLNHSLQPNSRIGAKVKASDNLVGRFEYGHSSTVNLRLLYGEYDFGGFKLMVGQSYTPLCIFVSSQVYGGDRIMLSAGGIYNGRRAMVRGKFGGLQVALVQPTTPDLGGFAGADTDVTIPMLQAKYTFKVAGLSLDVAGGYQTYDVVDANDDDQDVSSYIGAISAKYNMGPLSLRANYWMGQNVGNMGMANYGFDNAVWDPVEEDFLDNNGYGFLLVAAFKLSDMLRFEAGYGYTNFDLDEANEKDDTTAYYVQAKINLAKGMFIVPEIGKYDYGDDPSGNDEGESTYYGLKWQINF